MDSEYLVSCILHIIILSSLLGGGKRIKNLQNKLGKCRTGEQLSGGNILASESLKLRGKNKPKEPEGVKSGTAAEGNREQSRDT